MFNQNTLSDHNDYLLILKYHKNRWKIKTKKNRNLKKKASCNNSIYFLERRVEGGKILPNNLVIVSRFSVLSDIIGMERSITLKFVFLSQVIHSSSNLLETFKTYH